MIRNQTKITSVAIMPDVSLDLNAFSSKLGSARVLRNWVPERGRLARKAFSPDFTVKPDGAGGDVWHLINYRYTRASAPNNKLITFRGDGKVYQRQSSYEQEIYPAETSTVVVGPNNPSAASSESGSGGAVVWSSTGNVFASDDTRATANMLAGEISQYLQVTGFGFAVPASSVIQGIVVEVEVRKTSGVPQDWIIAIVKSGSPSGTSKSPANLIPSSDTYLSYGTGSDLWGLTWTPGDINDSTFGVAWSTVAASGQAAVVEVDHIRIKVFYGPDEAVLNNKPFAKQLSNRLFFSDGIVKKVWDGRSVQDWGLTRSTTAPTLTAQNLGGSIVAATGVKGCITWVVLDEESNRVHESSRSNVGNSSFLVIGGTDDSVRFDISSLSAPSRATHWSAYLSELDGSEVFRRAATTAIATTTVDITAFPAATNAKAPIRNDPPPPSTVGAVAKNRIWLRDDENPNTFYFSALGEVVGLANGAADESFPGYGDDSISDLKNSDFIPDQELRCIVEHENIVFIFGNSNGYAYIGEVNALDNRAPRSLNRLQIFNENCAGPDGAASTPYGLAWMNTGRKIWLWLGGQELTDIGEPIQSMLDTIPAEDIFSVHFTWYSGNGRQWLLVNANCAATDDATGSGEQWRTLIYDFSRPSLRPLGGTHPGSWYEWIDVTATTASVYRDDEGLPFLLLGDTNSKVRQADVIAHPAHLEYTAKLGSTYLSSSSENNPACRLRTGLLMPASDLWATGHYLQVLTGAQAGPGAPSAGSLTDPTVAFAVDIENPDLFTNQDISLTLDTATSAGDKRAWLIPQASGNTNVGGALGKQFMFDLSYAAGNDATGESDGRTTTRINSVYKVGFTYAPQKEATV